MRSTGKVIGLSVLLGAIAIKAAFASTFVFTPYGNGAAEYLRFLDRAKQTVLIACYSFDDPAITNKLIELKSRGVSVHMLLDRSQSRGKKEMEEIERLRQAGIDLVIGSSVVRSRILHCKFSILDSEYVEDGSWNYTINASQQDNVLEFYDDPVVAANFTNYWNRMRSDILGSWKQSGMEALVRRW